MTITHLGAKRLQGTKSDRKSDSLGSSADGTNTAITQTEGKLGGSPPNILVKDAQATTNTSSSGTTITNSSFTVANNSNRILIVCAYRFGSGGDISGITWNSSESFTRATFRDGSTETGRTEIWYLVNPTATTSNIVTTWDASTSRRGAGVYSFYNAKQTSPIGATAYDDEITTVTDGAITPTVSGSMIIDCIGSGSNGAPTDSLTAGWTSLIGGDDRSFSSQYKVDPTISSANTMAWTFASDKGVNWIAVEVKSVNPSGSSTGTGAYDFGDTTAGFVNLGTDSGLNLLTGGTITMWINYDDMTDKRWAGKGSNGAWEILSEGGASAGKIKFRVNDGSVKNAISTTVLSSSTWYHVAAVYDKSAGEIRLYINGSLEDTTSSIGQIATISTAAYLGRNEGGNYVDGKIDDVGIYSRVLTATEISDLGGFRGASSQWISVGNKWDKRIVYNGNTDTSNHGVSFDLYSALGNSVASNTWVLRFEHTVTSTIGTTNGDVNVFCGLSDKDMNTTHQQDQDWIGVRLMLSAKSGSDYGLIRPNSSNDASPQSGSASNNYGYMGSGTENTKFYIEIKRTSSSAYTVSISNGDDYNGDVLSATGGSTSATALRYIKFGDQANNSTQPWNGKIENVQFWDNTTTAGSGTAVSIDLASEQGALVSSLSDKSGLKAYYSMDAISGATSGIAPDDGGNANSYAGVSLDSTNKILGTYSYDFSGSSSGVVGNSNQSYGISGTASWTISCWIRPHNLSGNEAIFRKQHADSTADFEFGANSSNIFCWIEGNSTNMVSSPANNTWYHLVIRRVSGDKDYFYVNGAEVANTSTQNSIDDPSGFRWYLGRRKESNNEPFEGNMDEWGIWNRALTTSEITALYNSGNGAKVDSISTTDLVIYWNFEQIPLAQQALPKCSNDFSATSDLLAMTNLPVNTIFEQTDDTPSYWWKQSDNTWKLDGSPPLHNNLHAWYDASDSSSVTKDSSNLVSQLNDKSGNGYNLTASGTGTGGQPLWVSGGKNDLDIVDFGSSKQMKAQWTAKSQPVTYVAFMYSPASDGSQDNFWDNYDDTNSSMGFANVDTSNNLAAYAPTNLGSISSTNYTQKWGLFTVIYNTTSSQILINGDQKASGNIGTNSSYGLTLSCHRTSATYGQIKLAEMLIYDKVLSSDELTTINNYFVNKWGAVLE